MYYFCQNIAFLKNYYLYNSIFDSNIRNRLDSTIPTLEIESTIRFQLLELTRLDSGRISDPNSITRPDAISLIVLHKIDLIYLLFLLFY